MSSPPPASPAPDGAPTPEGPRPAPDLHRRFTRLTLLNILTNVSIPLAGLVDTAILGHLPDVRFLGGVALGAMLFDFVYWSLGFLRMGTTGLTAQAVGAERDGEGPGNAMAREESARKESARENAPPPAREMDDILYRSIVLGLSIAALLLVFSRPLVELGFGLLQGEPGVEAAGRSYMAARLFEVPARLVNFALLGWFLGREESGRALAMTVTANGVNIVLDVVFVLGLGWQAAGAGAATALGQWAMLAVGVGLFLARRRPSPLRRERIFDRAKLRALLSLNRDILVRTLCLVGTFVVFTALSASFGTVVLAANTILLRLVTFTAYAIDGAAYATESLAGIFHGAGDRASLDRLIHLSLLVGVLFPVPLLAAVLFAPDALYGLLTSHGDVIAEATRFGPWLVPLLLIGSVAYVYDGLFIGLTAGRALRNAMVLSTVAGFLPPIALAVALGNNHLLWLAMTLFTIARSVTLQLAKGKLLDGPPVASAV